MQSQFFNGTAGSKYMFCIYARLGPGSPASAPVLLNIMPSNYNKPAIATASVQLTTATPMKRVCVFMTSALATSGKFYFAAQMGTIVAVYYFDDVALEFVQ